ncbi:hypothetical protein Ancab_029572 [Ancistrocladus abbreviatus]
MTRRRLYGRSHPTWTGKSQESTVGAEFSGMTKRRLTVGMRPDLKVQWWIFVDWKRVLTMRTRVTRSFCGPQLKMRRLFLFRPILNCKIEKLFRVAFLIWVGRGKTQGNFVFINKSDKGKKAIKEPSKVPGAEHISPLSQSKVAKTHGRHTKKKAMEHILQLHLSKRGIKPYKRKTKFGRADHGNEGKAQEMGRAHLGELVRDSQIQNRNNLLREHVNRSVPSIPTSSLPHIWKFLSQLGIIENLSEEEMIQKIEELESRNAKFFADFLQKNDGRCERKGDGFL